MPGTNTKQNNVEIITLPKVISFFSNPWLGAITSLCTILGLIFAIYTFASSNITRNLIYTIYPIKALALRSGEVSNLKVFYEEKEIKTDITVAQLAIWNKGKIPIKPDNILKTIKITTNPSTPILEVQIRKQSRDVIGFTIGSSYYNEGYIPVSWDILENGDGAIIQIIYSGSEDVKFSVEGVIEGQNKISIQNPPNNIKTPEEQQSSSNSSFYVFLVIFLLYTTLLLLKLFVNNPNKRKLVVIKLSDIVIFVMFLLCSVYCYYSSIVYGPPFGF